MKFIQKTNGETIVEVLVATVLLVAVLATSFITLNRAAITNVNVQKRIVAINLAREGLEAVRNIRDTNWLKYSGNRREKWLCLDSSASPNNCTGTNSTLVITGFYQINYSETQNRYFLVEVEGADELNVSGNSAGLDSFRLYRGQNTKKLMHDDNGGQNAPTPFYRQIEIDVQSNELCTDGCREEKIMVTSRVGWIESGNPKNVTLETHLFDFYQRDKYED